MQGTFIEFGPDVSVVCDEYGLTVQSRDGRATTLTPEDLCEIVQTAQAAGESVVSVVTV